jgi:hypothetical protein
VASDVLHAIATATQREQALARAHAGYPGDVTPTPDKLAAMVAAAAAFREAGMAYALIGGVAVGIRSGVPRAAADPARPRSKALGEQADIALLEGDVPEPGEGW